MCLIKYPLLFIKSKDHYGLFNLITIILPIAVIVINLFCVYSGDKLILCVTFDQVDALEITDINDTIIFYVMTRYDR